MDTSAADFVIAKLAVKPGDIVVVKCWLRSQDDKRLLESQLSTKFPDLRFMAVPKDWDLAVVSPEPEVVHNG